MKKNRLLAAVFLFFVPIHFFSAEYNTADFDQCVSSYTSQKIDEFLTFRVQLRSGERDFALKRIYDMRRETLELLEVNAVDFEQERLILESMYFIEVYEHELTDENRVTLRRQMKMLMQDSLSLMENRTEAQLSKWMYMFAGDVMAYYVTRSVAATMLYGYRLKALYEKAIALDPSFTSANVSLGNWFFYTPVIFGGGKKKAEACYKAALAGARTPGEQYLSYLFLSQFYFTAENEKLSRDYFDAAEKCNLGTKQLEFVKKCNRNGISLFQYNRNRAGIDRELSEAEKEPEDR